MKKVYNTPCVNAEEFVANEYVAACYSVKCEFGGDNPYSTDEQKQYWKLAEYGSGVTHGGSCTEANRDYILTNDTVTTGSTIREYSSDQGFISGKITLVVSGGADGPVGDTVYWYTRSGNNDRQWNHKGTITLADSHHPNRS